MDFKAFESRYIYDPNKDQLGRGGFGTVFKAYDCKYDIHVAIKRSEVKDANEKYSLFNEVKRAKALRHRHLIYYHDCFRFENQFGTFDYAILDYCEEGGLHNIMEQGLSLEQKKELTHGILKGLQYLHDHNIIHRDLKPHNILIDVEEGKWVPKIADFGLSRTIEGDLTLNSTVIHTPEYAAPEQITEDLSKIGVPTDLWSLGVVLFELFTGILPFGSRKNKDSAHTITQNILDAKLPDSIEQIPDPYQLIIRCCLVRDIEKRIQSVEEIQALIKRVNEKPTSAPSKQEVKPVDNSSHIESPSSHKNEKPAPTSSKREDKPVDNSTQIAAQTSHNSSSQLVPPPTQEASFTDTPTIIEKKKERSKIKGGKQTFPERTRGIPQALFFLLYVGIAAVLLYDIFGTGFFHINPIAMIPILCFFVGVWIVNYKHLFKEWGLHWMGVFFLISLGASQGLSYLQYLLEVDIDFLHPIINTAIISSFFLCITAFLSLFNRSKRSSLNRACLWIINNAAISFILLALYEVGILDPIMTITFISSLWILRSFFYFIQNRKSLTSTDFSIQYWVWGGLLSLPVLLAHYYFIISHYERPLLLSYSFAVLPILGYVLLFFQKKATNSFSIILLIIGISTSLLLLSTNLAYLWDSNSPILAALIGIVLTFLLFSTKIRQSIGM